MFGLAVRDEYMGRNRTISTVALNQGAYTENQRGVVVPGTARAIIASLIVDYGLSISEIAKSIKVSRQKIKQITAFAHDDEKFQETSLRLVRLYCWYALNAQKKI